MDCFGIPAALYLVLLRIQQNRICMSLIIKIHMNVRWRHISMNNEVWQWRQTPIISCARVGNIRERSKRPFIIDRYFLTQVTKREH